MARRRPDWSTGPHSVPAHPQCRAVTAHRTSARLPPTGRSCRLDTRPVCSGSSPVLSSLQSPPPSPATQPPLPVEIKGSMKAVCQAVSFTRNTLKLIRHTIKSQIKRVKTTISHELSRVFNKISFLFLENLIFYPAGLGGGVVRRRGGRCGGGERGAAAGSFE